MNNGAEEFTIVVIEDDPNDAELLMRVFRKRNIANKIILLRDGAQALDFFFPPGGPPAEVIAEPKIILLDLKLPKINGLEVIEKLKSDARTEGVPIVVLTSSREPRDVKNACALGIGRYFTKPLKFEDLAEFVSRLGMEWVIDG